MIDDWNILTLWVYDGGDEMDEGDVASCSGMMKGTGSTFIFLLQDLWALPHQVLEESQVTLLSQLGGNVNSNGERREDMYPCIFLVYRGSKNHRQ